MSSYRGAVLVTGANGFVGRHVVPFLTRDGWTVRGAVRRASSRYREVVVGPIGSTTDWSAALVDVEAVVHLAARVHQPNDRCPKELYHSVNVDGTLHLARRAANAGVRHFVFISTVHVHGRSSDGRSPFSELDALTPLGCYGVSKAEAEVGLRVLAQESDMSVTIIRPPLIYGSGAKGNFAALAWAAKLAIPLPLQGITNCRAFLSVENLSSFISWRLLRPTEKFNVFLVADAEQVSTPEFFLRLAKAAGARPLIFRVSPAILSALLVMSGRKEAQEGLIGSLELDLSKVIATGWRPILSLDEGLAHAFAS